MLVCKRHTWIDLQLMPLQADGRKLDLMHCSLGRSTEAKEQSLTTYDRRRLNAIPKPIEVQISV